MRNADLETRHRYSQSTAHHGGHGYIIGMDYLVWSSLHNTYSMNSTA